ncbi:MAG: sigma-54 dependent transcriptional regulator [Myxococcota bacterium]|nr:sigma-54 dependent transcriptional regulator [Myxococcota bacterium]
MADIVLAIDPSESLASELEAALLQIPNREGRVLRARTAHEALVHLDYGWVDLVLCGPDARGLDGYDLVPQLRRHLPRIAIGFAATTDPASLANQALERDVHEILPRPVDPAALHLLLQRTARHERDQRTHGLLHRELRRTVGERPLVAASRSMIRVLEHVEVAAGKSAPTLIVGEPGTGKESIARAIHEQSARRDFPFVALPCTGVASTYIESELFGRARGESNDAAPARRGLLVDARGGTLFLDELGGLTPALQTRLAMSIQEGAITVGNEGQRIETDVHIIASTQRDLERETKAGRFSNELFRAFELPLIPVPPLRERREDVALLADHMLRSMSIRHGKTAHRLADEALDLISRYTWPGNVRELENTLERAVLLTSNEKVERQDLPEALQRDDLASDDDVWALRPARRAAERTAILRALRATGGNRTHAAKRLRISPRALLYKLKDYGIRD